jgi:hypothetical protein
VNHHRIAFFLVIVAAFSIAGAASGAVAATPTEAQAVAMTLKASMMSTFKKEGLTITVDKVTCVLPQDGVVVHCIADAAGPPASREDVVFNVTETLHANGSISWTATHTCTDSKTHKPFPC